MLILRKTKHFVALLSTSTATNRRQFAFACDSILRKTADILKRLVFDQKDFKLNPTFYRISTLPSRLSLLAFLFGFYLFSSHQLIYQSATR
jgi:hypothetical protein